MAGVAVNVRPADARRIGLTGIGVDDLGVIENASAISDLLGTGLSLGAVTERRLSAMTALPHGSAAQVKSVTTLSQITLKALGKRIENRVNTALQYVLPEPPSSHQKYLDWARESGWEFPVIFGLSDRDHAHLRMVEDAGLTVLSCPVADVSDRIGDVLCALVEWLSLEALKHNSIDGLRFRYELMGVTVGTIDQAEATRLRRLTESELVPWFKAFDNDGYEEMLSYYGSNDELGYVASQFRDVLCESSRLDRTLASVHGTDLSREDRLSRILAVAKHCPRSSLRQYVVRACSVLDGPSVDSMIRDIPHGELFERLPGEFAFVDVGLNIDGVDDFFHEQHEMAMQSDDMGELPLQIPSDALVDLLTRITIAERLLIGLAALFDER